MFLQGGFFFFLRLMGMITFNTKMTKLSPLSWERRNGDHKVFQFHARSLWQFMRACTLPLTGLSLPKLTGLVTHFSDRKDLFQECKKSSSDLLRFLPKETPFFTYQLKDVFVFHSSLYTLAPGSSAELHRRRLGLFTWINHRKRVSKSDSNSHRG